MSRPFPFSGALLLTLLISASTSDAGATPSLAQRWSIGGGGPDQLPRPLRCHRGVRRICIYFNQRIALLL